MSLSDLNKELLLASQKLKNGEMTKKFLKSTAKKLKKETLKVAKSKVGKKTGNYERGIKEGKPYEYDGAYACRVYSTMPHAHLIEHGHIIVGRDGKEKGFKDGYYVFENAASNFEKDYEEEAEKFMDEIIGELWLSMRIY